MLSHWYLPAFCSSFLLSLFCLSLEWRGCLWFLLLTSCLCTLIVKPKALGGICLLGVLASLFIFSTEIHKLTSLQQTEREEITLQAVILKKELRSGNRQRITFRAENILYQATLYRYPEFTKGDWVEVGCIRSTPRPFSGFAYDRYLFTQNIYYLCEIKQIEKILHQEKASFLEKGRIFFAQKIRSIWPRPTSSLVAGLLLGTRESFSQKVLEDFSRAGVTHIIALSGFNIAILIIAFEKLLVMIYVPRKARLLTVLASIIVFTIFVGAGPSITRAAIMGSLAYIAVYLGRVSDVLRVMLLTATVMCFVNPFILVYDIGFQLSFLSTIGLVYLTPIFSKLFSFLPKVFSLQESFVTTMAATIATLPLVVFQFGNISFVSPFANVLILPVIPWLMLISFLAVILETLSLPLLFFDHLSTLGVKYVLGVSSFFSQPTWASQSFILSKFVFVVFLLLLFSLIIFSHFYEKRSV